MIVKTSIQEVNDIVDNADERELWIVGREFERPPYFHAGKGGDTRLARALRVCVENRIAPNSDGTYLVEGSEHRTYRVGDSCSCPQSQKAQSRWCYHAVAVALYVEWQRRLRGAAPVALGTLRAGTLPLPPVTVEERLAHAAAVAMDHVYDALPTPQGNCMPDDDAQVRITVDGVDYPPDVPQEAPMPDDAYLPEPAPAHGTTAVLDAADADFPPLGQPATRPLPGPVLLPALDARTLEQSMQAWAEQRQVVKRFIQTQLVEGTDYYSLKIGQRETRPTLSKAGSEKFLGLFQLRASFTQDDATWTMLGKPEGTLCYVCTLHTRSGEMVSEGRGARRVSQDSGDINKAVKMAQKSATIDAVLRTGALSEAFTQDIREPDDQPAPQAETPGPPTSAALRTGALSEAFTQDIREPDDQPAPQAETPGPPTSAALRQQIWARVQELASLVQTREAVATWIKGQTGYDLHPDHYTQILEKLSAVGR